MEYQGKVYVNVTDKHVPNMCTSCALYKRTNREFTFNKECSIIASRDYLKNMGCNHSDCDDMLELCENGTKPFSELYRPKQLIL